VSLAGIDVEGLSVAGQVLPREARHCLPGQPALGGDRARMAAPGDVHHAAAD